MTSYIALLRGINVGGKKKVPMADLQAMVAGLGFVEARTLLNSGNVVLRSKKEIPSATLETLLETEAAKRLGLQTDFHVRTAAEWHAAIQSNPLPAEAMEDPSHFVLVCLKTAPTAAAVETLLAANPGKEIIRAIGRHLYIAYGGMMADSKLTSALMDGKLGTRGTARNWNTVQKLGKLVGR